MTDGWRCTHFTVFDCDAIGYGEGIQTERCQLDEGHQQPHEFISAWDTSGKRLHVTWVGYSPPACTIEEREDT